MNKIKCLYCNKEKNSNEYSLEHIFPDALGGSLFSQEFKTRNVCTTCNSTSGLFIDGAFIKNFFSQNDKSQAFLSYVDFENPVAMPMTYIGQLNNFIGQEDEICDIWFGPHGGIVYHVRKKADSRYDTMIGGNPIDNRKINGWIGICPQNSDPYWNKVLLLSCKKQFGKARRLSSSIKIYPQSEHDDYFEKPTKDEECLLEFFSSMSGQEHAASITISIGFEQRFLAKLALGLGYNLFGNKFLESEYSQDLRNAMWERDLNKRSKKITFSNYLQTITHDFSETLKWVQWEGVHTIIILPTDNILYLIFYCFGYKLMMIPLCNDQDLWSRFIPSDGIVYIAAPQLEIFSGSLSLIDVISHKTGDHKIKILEEIDKRKINIRQLPKITDYPST